MNQSFPLPSQSFSRTLRADMRSLCIVVRDELSGANEQYVHCGFNEHFICPHQRNFLRMRVLAATNSTRLLHFVAVRNPQNLFNSDCSIFRTRTRSYSLQSSGGGVFHGLFNSQDSSGPLLLPVRDADSRAFPPLRGFGNWGCSGIVFYVPVDATLEHMCVGSRGGW